MSRKQGKIYVGVGGWTFEPWRGSFFPAGLAHARELRFASERLSTIEINGTFYRTQSPATFRKWRDETPEHFVFSVKAPRYAVNRTTLADASDSVQRFFDSGVSELGAKLGPILWQFAATKKFDPMDFEAFLALLPSASGGVKLMHAVEPRHASFRCEAFIDLARKYKVAVVLDADSKYPLIGDLSAPFVYARIQGTTESEPLGYSDSALDLWAARLKLLAGGSAPDDLTYVMPQKKASQRDVYLYVISGFKARNPLAAMALMERLA